MATGTTGQNQPTMTYPDVYFYMYGVNPNLAGLLDMGCRMGKTVQDVLATMREVEFGDPAAKAAWQNAIEVARGKVQQWGAGACTWSDPRSTALAAVSSRMPALPTAAQNAIAAANLAAMTSNQQASGYQFQPGGGQAPAAGTIDDGHTHTWDGGRCEVLEGGARCGPIEGGHCGKKCGGACDSCLRPTPNGKMCMWDAPAPSAASLSQACAQPLRWNCETIDADLATCEIDRIRRTQRTWSKTVSTGSGLIVVPADAAHEVPAGYTLYAFELPAMRLSHWLCLRSVQLLGTPAGGGGAVPIIPDMVFIEVEKIWMTGNGEVVHAWTYAKPEEQEYITIKDGRCACARLCDCVPARSRARILALVPTPAAGTIVSMSGKGKRECWGAMCGPCPPELICDRSRIVDPVPVVLPNSPSGMLAFIQAQEPVTGVSVEEVFEQIMLAPGVWDITAPEFVQYLVAAPGVFKADVLEPIVGAYLSLGWTAFAFAAAFDLAGGTLSSDVFGELAATGSIAGARFATALAGAPAGVQSAALIPLMGSYSTYGWTGATLAQAIDLAGGTLDVDLVTAIGVNNYITGSQYATAIQFFNAGNKASILTVSIGNYVANGWTAIGIRDALVAAGGTLAADVKAALP